MSHRWEFYDSTVPETWTFTYNPESGGSIARNKKIVTTETSATSGNTIVFEGQAATLQTEVRGFILDQDHLEELERWYNKDHAVQLTDDLGRIYEVYITSFVPERERAVHSPWKHSFTMKMLVLQELT